MKKYEIWLLGYDNDYSANDFEHFVEGFTEKYKAKVFFDAVVGNKYKYWTAYGDKVPRCQVVLEEVENSECVDRVMEDNLW